MKNALKLYNKAIEINPKNANAYADRGYVLLKFKEPYWFIKAIQDFTIALSINKNLKGMHHNRALGKYYSKNYFGSIFDCLKDIELMKIEILIFYLEFAFANWEILKTEKII